MQVDTFAPSLLDRQLVAHTPKMLARYQASTIVQLDDATQDAVDEAVCRLKAVCPGTLALLTTRLLEFWRWFHEFRRKHRLVHWPQQPFQADLTALDQTVRVMVHLNHVTLLCIYVQDDDQRPQHVCAQCKRCFATSRGLSVHIGKAHR